MNKLNIVNNVMTSKDFSRLTGNKVLHSNQKALRLLSELGLDTSEQAPYHPEYQIIRDKEGYIEDVILNRDLSIILAGQYEPKVAYKVLKAFDDLRTNEIIDTSKNLIRSARMLSKALKDSLPAVKQDKVFTLDNVVIDLLKNYLASKTDESGTVLNKMKRNNKVKLSWLARNTRNKQGFKDSSTLDGIILRLESKGVLTACEKPSVFKVGTKDKVVRAYHYKIDLSKL